MNKIEFIGKGLNGGEVRKQERGRVETTLWTLVHRLLG